MPVRNNRGIVTKRDVSRTAVGMKQLSKHVFSMPSGPKGYKKDKENNSSQWSFETPACQDIYQLGSRGIELRHQNY
jgi:hypothetical protein